ncbi:class I SAM-dependent methyltransferase [Oxalobacter vibrioformis]|uniref:Class I SAM-dependent methyltransferase n=1 Tax=Oxalobacter vibrioformis TaxID=933080 RepID=A0A9E9LVD1_9BURK|nr:class I SAM-dependent methyltransferase [Oxalobacter vibrioformis]WAW09831.1 class I SAM-dependent methyltransferase [Oxalobacter vibrioformis]
MTDPKEKNRHMWDTRYGESGYFYGTAPNAWLAARQVYFRPGMRVLVPADGEGRNSVWCAQQGMTVDAFDLSPVAVEKARALAAEKGVSVNYAVASIDSWVWQAESYDAVVLIFMNFATPNMRNRLFTECIQALRPGGILFLHGYRAEQLQYGTGGPPVIEQLYTEAMLREALDPLIIVEVESYDASLSEGKGHNGMSALIGVVAKKIQP